MPLQRLAGGIQFLVRTQCIEKCLVPWTDRKLIVVSSSTSSIGYFERGTVALQISNIRGRLSIEGINFQSHQDTHPSSQHTKTTA